ncbi:hypothetical protein DBV15_10410 [Temnothorax longispinosus]|uniref:Uncharacterized protein n=1 Tax=Temnothorax longispinosus TaxID=300112 RepID=A0A4S2L479_9HYME|nr:hypothetical protein DBV15_10410 [Temnothorax longispinosus]
MRRRTGVDSFRNWRGRGCTNVVPAAWWGTNRSLGYANLTNRDGNVSRSRPNCRIGYEDRAPTRISEMSCGGRPSVYRLTTATTTRRRRTSSWKADLNREGGKPRRLP